jgi:hypothetical protein
MPYGIAPPNSKFELSKCQTGNPNNYILIQYLAFILLAPWEKNSHSRHPLFFSMTFLEAIFSISVVRRTLLIDRDFAIDSDVARRLVACP